jgi:cell division septal protein FtsQ
MTPQRQVRHGRQLYGPDNRNEQKVSTFAQNWRAVVFLLGAGLVLFGLARGFSLEQINVQGTKNLEEAAVSRMAGDILKTNPFGFNLLTLSDHRLEKLLLAREPQLAQVKVKRQWPHALLLQVTEKELVLEWTTGTKKYLIDAGGSVVGEGEHSQLLAVTDQTGLAVRVGDRVVPGRFVAFCQELVRQRQLAGLEIKQVEIAISTSEVSVHTQYPYVIKFDTTRGAEAQLKDLAKVQQELKRLGRTPSEYIDLRVADKAYYR